MRVTLASASPRRRELIKKIEGLEVEIRPSGESEEEIALSPVELVKILALKKAQSVFSQTGGIVIGADTIVTIDGMVLGKPSSEIEAKGFFRFLKGLRVGKGFACTVCGQYGGNVVAFPHQLCSVCGQPFAKTLVRSGFT